MVVYGINSKSEQKKKKLAWEVLKFICIDTEFLESWAESEGIFVNKTEVIKKLSMDDSFVNKTVNQNPYTMYKSELLEINGKLFCNDCLDRSIENNFEDSTIAYLSGKMSKEEALNYFKESVKEDFKDIVVE